MSTSGKTSYKMDKRVWEDFMSYLDRAPSNQCIGKDAIVLDTLDVLSATDAITGARATPEASDLLKNWKLGEQQQNVVILSSDSETDEEAIWSNNAKCKSFKRILEKARCLIFYRIMPTKLHYTNTAREPLYPKIVEQHLFPNEKFKELAEELRKFTQDCVLSDKEYDFLWNNVVQWLLAVKQSSDPLDLNYDEQFDLILIDFMVQYVNYITSRFSNSADKAKIDEKVFRIVQTLIAILSGNSLHIRMVLLRIDLKLEYRSILEPIFRNYLTERCLCHASNDLVVYLCLIFCFKRWKMITPLKTDREQINELAASILPKSVPKINAHNEFLFTISDLIGFAVERKAIGTRILLVYTSLNLEDAIPKYFQLYARYVSRNASYPAVDVSAALRRKRSNLSTKHISDATLMHNLLPSTFEITILFLYNKLIYL